MRRHACSVALTLLLLLPAVAPAQTFTVTTNADAGPGSLRQAIGDAKAFGGAAMINLNAGLGTISINTMLPILSNPSGITINGNGNTIDGGSALVNAGTLTADTVAFTDIRATGGSGESSCWVDHQTR